MHKEIVYGLGLSLMDLKVKPQVEEALNQKLPRDFEQFIRFIHQSELIHSCAGGIVSNILMAFAKMKPSSHVGLFAAIGTDKYGDWYQKKIQQQLGQLQRI